ncbi:type I methionyl aminopeptidase [candidate division WWE3 bacterium]|jgi:methionyl aminopeptidase|uniref:Methionine aminopeptidase n=1 Tax=candidate division WWE3 bacterium TaxID=2053526 RepID=A0A3A4ZIX0_UNCKA|nr:MAG: type I methionyl aminopeptidase [candidate division WWE3 bacterium]
MTITIKSPDEIKIMREAGKILAKIMTALKSEIRVGRDLWDIEIKFLDYCRQYNVIPACKGYTAMGFLPPFPTGLCVSTNEESVHCFPSKGEIVKDGDLITIDTVISYKGLHVDAAFTVGAGNVKSSNIKFMNTAKKALLESVELVKEGVKVGVISNKIQTIVEAAGYSVLKDYAGHGIGKSMHELPEIPCYGKPTDGPVLERGMTICIETLVSEGKPTIKYVSDWETEMKDGKNFVQYEYTLLVKEKGYEILTDFEV